MNNSRKHYRSLVVCVSLGFSTLMAVDITSSLLWQTERQMQILPADLFSIMLGLRAMVFNQSHLLS
jgi:hypothetical protein